MIGYLLVLERDPVNPVSVVIMSEMNSIYMVLPVLKISVYSPLLHSSSNSGAALLSPQRETHGYNMYNGGSDTVTIACWWWWWWFWLFWCLFIYLLFKNMFILGGLVTKIVFFPSAQQKIMYMKKKQIYSIKNIVTVS